MKYEETNIFDARENIVDYGVDHLTRSDFVNFSPPSIYNLLSKTFDSESISNIDTGIMLITMAEQYLKLCGANEQQIKKIIRGNLYHYKGISLMLVINSIIDNSIRFCIISVCYPRYGHCVIYYVCNSDCTSVSFSHFDGWV